MTRISRHYSKKIQLKAQNGELPSFKSGRLLATVQTVFQSAPRLLYYTSSSLILWQRSDGPPVNLHTQMAIMLPICLLALSLHLPLAPIHEHQHLRSRTKASLGIYALVAPLGARTAVGYLRELLKKWRRPYTLAYFRGTRCLEPGFCRVYPEIHSNIFLTPSGSALGSMNNVLVYFR